MINERLWKKGGDNANAIRFGMCVRCVEKDKSLIEVNFRLLEKNLIKIKYDI